MAARRGGWGVAATSVALALATGVAAAQQATTEGPRPPTVHMVGDSTMADKPTGRPNPERGWGQLFPGYFVAGVRVVNHAVNGRSTRSFRDLGNWARVVEQLRPGDYVIVQFGHNDQKREDPARFADAETDYRRNLERYVAEARERGARPILATPIVRRHFDDQGALLDRHGAYPGVMREVASRLAVPLLELHGASDALVRRLGPQRSEPLYLSRIEPGDYETLPEGKRDDTHLSALGATRVCDLAAAELRRAVPDLAAWLRD
ncbi:MAG: rhamnogalacturonan acetylesterase [Vicinamibacteria bacterium]|nr:rhamnogalacturonan acetylesterase [Vicinamibacteria bacterium]